MVSDAGLIVRLAAVQESVDELREDYRLEAVKRDKRIRTNKHATYAAIAAAVLGVLVGAWGIKISADADASRKQRTIAACEQYNVQQTNQRDAEIAQSHDFVNALARGIEDPVERAKAVKAYNTPHDALIRGGHLLRDCSPAGIARYYRTSTTKG